MATCDQCGEEENMPYQCRYCGGTFCATHRLPENHHCPGLEEWDDPRGVWGDDSGGVFDSGFDDSVTDRGAAGGILSRLDFNRGILSYFRGNMTYVFLALMWITFFVQQLFLNLFVIQGPNSIDPAMRDVYRSIFLLTTENPEFVWTWVTSIFSHGGLYHIAGNSIVIFFFGRLLERYVGTRAYVALFLASGVLAALGQIAILLVQDINSGVLGASGAGLAIMGALTVLNPDLRVYLWFFLPIPIWALTGFYAVASVLGMIGPMAGVANGAHLIGLAIGVTYGQRVKSRIHLPRQIRFGGGGGGPGGGRRRF